MENPKIVALKEEFSVIIMNYVGKKLGDLVSFSIPCVIGKRTITALCDLGSSVSVLPLAVSQTLQLEALKPTSMTLQLADRTLRKPAGILEDVARFHSYWSGGITRKPTTYFFNILI